MSAARTCLAALLVLPLALGAAAARADDMADQILDVHNAERAAVGAPPLVWSDRLAADAEPWARHLAEINGLQHASDTGEGENLWQGTRGYFSYAQMVQGFADEKAKFRFGVFPDVSTDGDWRAVGHYTQMVWRGTTAVGCAKASNGENDFLVCRYDPPGNWIGEKPY